MNSSEFLSRSCSHVKNRSSDNQSLESECMAVQPRAVKMIHKANPFSSNSMKSTTFFLHRQKDSNKNLFIPKFWGWATWIHFLHSADFGGTYSWISNYHILFFTASIQGHFGLTLAQLAPSSAILLLLIGLIGQMSKQFQTVPPSLFLNWNTAYS